MWIRAIALIRGKHNSGATNCQLVCSGGAHTSSLPNQNSTDGHRFTYTYDYMSGYPRVISSQASKAFVNACSPNHNPKTSENCVRWVLSSDQVVGEPLIGIAYCICFSPKSVRIVQAEHCKNVSKNNYLTILHIESDFINPFSWTKETVALAIWVEQLQRVARQSHCCVVWAQNSKRSAFQPTARVCHDDATTDFSGSMATWAVTLPFAVSTNSIGLNPWWKKGAAADRRRFVCWVGGSQMCFFFHPQHEASGYFVAFLTEDFQVTTLPKTNLANATEDRPNPEMKRSVIPTIHVQKPGY